MEHAQEISDQEDERVLSNITREVRVEEGVQVHKIPIQKAKNFNFPKATKHVLPNGLTLLYYHNPNVPMIETLLSFKGKHYYDPEAAQGLISFMSDMLNEGTKKHTAIELAQAIELYGMNLETAPGYITLNMLSSDFERGLTLLHEILTESVFDQEAIEKVRDQNIADLKDYWDSPAQFASQLARDQVYKHHPYSKKIHGSLDSINAITRKDLISCYQQYITPDETIMVVVGDLHGYDIEKIIEKHLGSWQGPKVNDYIFPALVPLKAQEIPYDISRDQTVLCFAGLSIERKDPDFDKLLLFDQIFTGGVLGAMSSRLFQLREQSGLFYTIGGSLIKHSDKQPGMVFVKTIVSRDRLQEAEKSIVQTIDTAVDVLTEEELEQAKNALSNSLIDNFEANKTIASLMLFLEEFTLPIDYLDTRVRQLEKITVDEVKKATKKVLRSDQLVRIKIGRI